MKRSKCFICGCKRYRSRLVVVNFSFYNGCKKSNLIEGEYEICSPDIKKSCLNEVAVVKSLSRLIN